MRLAARTLPRLVRWTQPRSAKGRDELRRELAAPSEEVAPRLVDDIQLLAVEGFHFSFFGLADGLGNCFTTASKSASTCFGCESRNARYF
jgi:hypothetical protein